MKLSTKGRYGLRALIDLAVHEDEEAVSTAAIAARQNISESYLEQLMRLLKKAELVKSVRGASGGYHLAKNASEISVGEVLVALEGDLEPVNCSGFSETDACEGADLCVTKYVWKRINESVVNTVNSIMISELVSESRELIEKKGKVPTEAC